MDRCETVRVGLEQNLKKKAADIDAADLRRSPT